MAAAKERHFIISEADLEDFAKQVQAATMTTLVTLYSFSVDSEGAKALGQGLADFMQQYQGWREDRVIGKGVELLPDAEEMLTPAVRKVAVDTLYAAREDHKVMDQAAILVAANVLRIAGTATTWQELLDGDSALLIRLGHLVFVWGKDSRTIRVVRAEPVPDEAQATAEDLELKVVLEITAPDHLDQQESESFEGFCREFVGAGGGSVKFERALRSIEDRIEDAERTDGQVDWHGVVQQVDDTVKGALAGEGS